jgi:hypothetical protein
MLERSPGGIGCACAGCGAEQQAGPGTDTGAVAVAADRRASNRTDGGADHCAGHAAVDRGLLRLLAPDALRGIRTTGVIIGAELIEAHLVPGQRHHARAARK